MNNTVETNDTSSAAPESIPFRAETRQLLDILIHSLYTNPEIFIRELISNASDALTRMSFEMLTNREVLDPDIPLSIRIVPNEEEMTLTIEDTGIGMNDRELAENLGTIAHSGAKAFIEAVQESSKNISDVIGQFGVGFYSAFMVAEWIQVYSRSYRLTDEAAVWYSTGADTFTVQSADRANRGTRVVVKLKDDFKEFLQDYRIKEVIRKHSDFIPYPIYVGEEQEQVNRQTAIWRQSPREVDDSAYNDFFRQLTLDVQEPLLHTHIVIDAPVQVYSVLYIPSSSERGVFSLRREDGLKLYARKVLIQEYCKDLLPEYLRFIQGVVDSEDLPLNVSRETVQSNRVMAQLKKILTSKVLDSLKGLAKDQPEKYEVFWKSFGRWMKEGVATDNSDLDTLSGLLRFHTTVESQKWSSLDDYLDRKKTDQDKIYFIIGDDERSIAHSPHLDYFKRHDIEVLILTDPMDSFMLLRLNKYKEIDLVNVASADLKLPEDDTKAGDEKENLSESEKASLTIRFKTILGDRVTDVRLTDRLVDSPARLVDAEGGLNQEMQRVYRMLDRDYDIPKKVIELNPLHSILKSLAVLPEEDPRNKMVIEQVYEDALLIEGLHPDPAGMISRIQELIETALKK